ncbi:MAG: hypothetical protein ACYC2K_06970 [Gemmatimonadales bacterium]
MRTWTIGLVLLTVGSLVGCARQSAEKAIAKAEKDIEAIRPDAEKVAPADLAVLVDSVAAMKAHVTSGDYAGASRGARNLGLSIRDLRANLGNRRQQLTTGFTATSNELPGQVEAVVARVAEIGALRRLPPGIDPARFEALKVDAPTWPNTWAGAKQAYDAGNLAEAMSTAAQLKTKVADARRLLSMN